MEELEQISFQIISAVGTARSMYIEAIDEARDGNFDKAEELIAEGEKVFIEGHHSHTKLIQQEASGNHVEFQLLLMHAEDQLMSAEAFGIISKKIIELYKRVGK